MASTLAQLLVAGVPVVVDHLPLAAQRLLGDRLTTALNEVHEARLSDSRYRETWSVGPQRIVTYRSIGPGGTALDRRGELSAGSSPQVLRFYRERIADVPDPSPAQPAV